VFHGPARPRRRLIAAVSLAAMTAFTAVAAPASADDPRRASWMDNWLGQPQLAGNCSGARNTLAGLGITPSVRYGTDLLANAAGGQQRGKAYAGQLAVEVGVDMEKLAGLRGLTFDVSGDWALGTDLSADIGNTFTVAQYFEGSVVRLYNLYL
jgi:porin